MSILYEPRQRRRNGVPTGKWDFCEIDHFGHVAPVGYCAKERTHGEHDGHHTNPHAALKCFHSYILDNIRFDGTNFMMFPCATCGNKTFGCSMVEGEPFVPCCGPACGRFLKDKLKGILEAGRIEVFAEACDNEKLDDDEPDGVENNPGGEKNG